MDSFIKYIIFASIHIYFSYGLDVDKGCPYVEPVGDFNLTAILGLWHEIARYPNDFEKTNCGAFDHKIEGDKIKVQLVDLPQHSPEYVETLFVVEPEAGDKGILTHEIMYGNPRVSVNVQEYILAIDYDKYYISYECDYKEDTKEFVEYAWIMTRSKNYDADVKYFIDNFIDSSNAIKRSKLIWLESLEKTC